MNLTEAYEEAFTSVLADAVRLKDTATDVPPELVGEPSYYIDRAVREAKLFTVFMLAGEACALSLRDDFLDNPMSNPHLASIIDLLNAAPPGDSPEYEGWAKDVAAAWACGRNLNHVGYDALIGTDDELLAEELEELDL